MALQFRDDPRGDQFFALRTFRKDGSAAATPIWLAPGGRHWYAYTPGRSWKVRRLVRNPRIELARSDFHGEPQEPWRPGRARVLPASELRTAKRAMTVKYGNKFRLLTIVTLVGRARKAGGRAVGLEIALDHGAPDHDALDRDAPAHDAPDADPTPPAPSTRGE